MSFGVLDWEAELEFMRTVGGRLSEDKAYKERLPVVAQTKAN